MAKSTFNLTTRHSPTNLVAIERDRIRVAAEHAKALARLKALFQGFVIVGTAGAVYVLIVLG
ncbi:MAG: hypothetical protein ACM3JC_08385 [Rudaea sp.]